MGDNREKVGPEGLPEGTPCRGARASSKTFKGSAVVREVLIEHLNQNIGQAQSYNK